MILSIYNPIPQITSLDTFHFLADLGMYFLLFIIGLEIDVKEICKQGKFISKLSFWLILSETLFGALFIHYVFDISWGISFLTASSFATVGEAILIPILHEFKIIKTKFGQTLLGVGTLDDIVELGTIIVMSVILGNSVGHSGGTILNHFFYFALLFFIPLFLQLSKSKIHRLKFKEVPPLFLFGLLVLFIFIGIGDKIDAAALGAIFAGLSLKNLLSEDKIEQFKSIISDISYGFFVPIFFLSVGMDVDIKYLFSAPLLIITILLITNTTKILTSYFIGRSVLGKKKSILLGIGLSAKFSTSIVIISMLYSQNVIPLSLYSVLVGAMIASKFIIPVAFAVLIEKWGIEFEDVEK